MKTKQVEQLKRNLGSRDTAELLEIWNENDRKSFTDEAFEAIRLILIERGVNVPQQYAYVPIEEKVTWSIPKGSGKKTAGKVLFWMGFAGIIISLILVLVTYVAASQELGYVGILLGVGALLMATVGAILFFVGKSQEKRQKNQNILLGGLLFVIGIGGVLVPCLILSFAGCYEPECVVWAITLCVIAGICGVLAFVGLLLVLAGIGEKMERSNIDEAEALQIEPEQTIDTHDGKEAENENIRKIYSGKGQTKRENKNGIGVDSSSPDSQWLTKFESIRSQTDSILSKVTAASTSTEEEISVALNEAIEKLSILLQAMKETPLPSKKEHQKYKKDVLAGMELFINGCQDNIEWFKTRQERSLTECSANISMAYGKFNKANIWLAKGSE